jgi:hypothetical protein
MVTLLCPRGHIASYAELLDHFNGQESAVLPFRDAPASSRVHRIRTNTYVCSHLDPEELLAARVGARLDCVTVLDRHGYTAGLPGRHEHVHLRMRRNDGRAAERRRAETRDIRTHWTPPMHAPMTFDAAARRWGQRAPYSRRTPVNRLEMPLDDALRQALASCLTVAESLTVLAAVSRHSGAETAARAVRALPAATRARLRAAGWS